MTLRWAATSAGGWQIKTGGTGTLTLNGNNSFTGISATIGGVTANVGVVLGAETLTIGNANALGTGFLEFNNTAAVLNVTAGGLTIPNGMVTNNVSASITGGSLTVNGVFDFGGTNTITVNDNLTLAGGVVIRPDVGATRTATFAGTGNLTIANLFAGSTNNETLAYTGRAR